MAAFLKIVSGIYLIFVWLTFAGIMKNPIFPSSTGLEPVLMFLGAVALSIPAVALFAFGQVVGDVRTIRNNSRSQLEDLSAMRRYYEPRG